jgi:hypothetical protein
MIVITPNRCPDRSHRLEHLSPGTVASLLTASARPEPVR